MSGPGTSTIIDWYAPACHDVGHRYVDALAVLDHLFQRHAYRPRPGVTGGFNCRHVTGGTGYSTHALGPGDSFRFWTGVLITTAGATDVNSDKNPYGPRLVTDMGLDMIAEVEAVRTVSGAPLFRWGGRYSGNKDAMHFEVICPPHDLASGINYHTVAGWPTDDEGNDEMTEADWARMQTMVNTAVDNAVVSLHRDITQVQDHAIAIKGDTEAIIDFVKPADQHP